MKFPVSQKHFFLLSLLAVFDIVIFLPHIVFAQFFGIVEGLGRAIELAIAGFLLAIPSGILGIASLLLQQAIDPSFIRIAYTTGPIIDTGWTVVRDFANMLIVFFLIIIGLATALRLGQYEAKKTLPKLIGVALLINFTPVITGFIVDTSNIFMNFFLEGLAGVGIITSIFESVESIIKNNLTLGGALAFIPKILLIMIFEIFAAIVFFLFAALFIIRRIAIWILVILSPIAFVASVLPRTSGLFKQWWNQFLQWSIIGVFAAFFLWLGDQIIGIAAQGKLAASAPPGGGISGFLTGTLNEIMPFGIALAMLLVGFFVALQSSAMGSGGITKFAQGTGRAAGAYGGRWALAKGKARILGSKRFQGAARTLEGAYRGWSPGWGKDAEGNKKAGMFAGMRRGVGDAIGFVNKRVVPFGTHEALRAVGRGVGSNLIEQERKEEAQAKSRARSMSQRERRAAFRTALSPGEKLGIVNGTIDAGDLQSDKDFREFGITGPELAQLAKNARRSELHKTIVRNSPHVAPLMDGLADPEKIDPMKAKGGIVEKNLAQAAWDKAISDAFNTIKPSDVKLMSEAALRNPSVKELALRKWDGRALGELGRNFPRYISDEYQAAFETKGKDWFLQNNPNVLVYASGNTAQDVGFRSLGGLTQAEVHGEIREWRQPIDDLKKEMASLETEIRNLRGTSQTRAGGGVVLNQPTEEAKEKARQMDEKLVKLQKTLDRKMAFQSASGASPEQPISPSDTGIPSAPRGRPGPMGTPPEEAPPRGRPGSVA